MAIPYSLTAFADFSDVDLDDLYFDAIDYLENEGLVVGYSDGTFGYNLKINRAELLKLIVESRYFGEDTDFLDVYTNADCFSDVPAGEWYTKYVCFAAKEEWVLGYDDGTFRPGQSITFVEALKITMEVFDAAYLESDPWYKGLVEAAASDNLIPLTIDSFNKDVTRAEVADMLTRRVKFDEDELEDFLGEKFDVRVTYDTIDEGEDMSEFLDDDEGGNDESDANQQDELTQYYKANLEISSFEYLYDSETSTMLNFSFLNNGDQDVEDATLKIVFQNNLLEDLFTYEIDSIYLDADGVKQFSDQEVDEVNSKLIAVDSANFYLDGIFFETVNVSVNDVTVSKLSVFNSSSTEDSVTLNVQTYNLGDDDSYYAECSLDGEVAKFATSETTKIVVSGLDSLTTYDCRAGIWTNGAASKLSDVVSIQTDYTVVVLDSTEADGSSVTMNIADGITLGEGESFYAKCLESGDEELAEDEDIHRKTVVSGEIDTVTVDGLRDNTDYDCYVGIQDSDGDVASKSSTVSIKTDLNEDQIDLSIAFGELGDGLYIILSLSNAELEDGQQFVAECTYSGGTLSTETINDPIVFDEGINADTVYACYAYIDSDEAGTISQTVFVVTP